MLTKEALFAAKFPEREVDIPALGGSVKVRGLSRAEALHLRGQDWQTADLERYILATAMIDPVLTDDEARKMQESVTTADVDPIVEAVLDLSGMRKSAPKEAVQTFRD